MRYDRLFKLDCDEYCCGLCSVGDFSSSPSWSGNSFQREALLQAVVSEMLSQNYCLAVCGDRNDRKADCRPSLDALHTAYERKPKLHLTMRGIKVTVRRKSLGRDGKTINRKSRNAVSALLISVQRGWN